MKEHDMQDILDVFNRLVSDSRTRNVRLSITADQKVIMADVGASVSISADDDMIVIRETKKIFGVSYNVFKHEHPSSLDELYDRIIHYITCKGKV